MEAILLLLTGPLLALPCLSEEDALLTRTTGNRMSRYLALAHLPAGRRHSLHLVRWRHGPDVMSTRAVRARPEP